MRCAHALRSHLRRSTTSALEKRIDPAERVRVHRSAFVRRTRVVEIAMGPNDAKAVTAALAGRGVGEFPAFAFAQACVTRR